ncbi:MAG: NAD(P) transhydrogenase subunit alpha [Flavobacteriales bacterium]
MTQYFISNIDGIYVLVFSLLIGIEVIKNIPAILHTPLMSGANAISGVILIGAIIQLLSVPSEAYMDMSLATLAIIMATINIAGGFFVTHRMLSMFSTKNKK